MSTLATATQGFRGVVTNVTNVISNSFTLAKGQRDRQKKRYPYAAQPEATDISLRRSVEQLVAAQRPLQDDVQELVEQVINGPKWPLPGYGVGKGTGTQLLTTTPWATTFTSGESWNFNVATKTNVLEAEIDAVWDINATAVVSGSNNVDVLAQLQIGNVTALTVGGNTSNVGYTTLNLSFLERFTKGTQVSVRLYVPSGSNSMDYGIVLKMVRVDLEPTTYRNQRGLIG